MLKKSKKGVKKFIIILSLGLGRFGKGQSLSAVKWRAYLARPPVAVAVAEGISHLHGVHPTTTFSMPRPNPKTEKRCT